MLTLKLISEETERVIKGLEKKHFKGAREAIDQVLAVDKKRREAQQELDKNLSEAKKMAAQIGALMKEGKRAEADAKCYRDEADYNHESLGILSERDMKQARAIEAFNREIQRLRDELDAAQKTIEGKDKEILLLHEALRSERDLSAALRTNSRLWENIKAGVKEGNA